jgi:uncharacterized protein YbbK (DUF523 family)
VFSRCLGFEACRYNGRIIASEAVDQLKPRFECVTVCPETAIGLGVPREPTRIVRAGGKLRLLQPATGRDLTARICRFARAFLDKVGAVDGFVLKSRSPSCGLFDADCFTGPEKCRPLWGGVAGFFAQAVLERFPHVPVENEVGLSDPEVRRRFLESVRAHRRARLDRRRPRRRPRT